MKYLELPDQALFLYTPRREGEPLIFDEIKDAPSDVSTLLKVSQDAWDNGQYVVLGPRDPRTLSDEIYDLYLEFSKLSMMFDSDMIPSYQFADAAEKPTKLGNVATITLHRMI